MATPTKSRAGAAKTHRPNYMLVFFSLAALTALEVLIASTRGIPGVPFLLGMSFIKAMLRRSISCTCGMTVAGSA